MNYQIINDLFCFLDRYSEATKTILIILGWLAIPLFNHRLTKKRERASLINKNIENIESLFKEMNELSSQQFKLDIQDNTIYYKLINCNQRLLLYCKRLTCLEPTFTIQYEIIKKIRKYTTNDQIIITHKEHGMHRLVYEQVKLIEQYPQQY